VNGFGWRRALRARWNRLPEAAVDVGLGVVFLAAMLIERIWTASAIGARMPVAVALSVVIAGALMLRRRAPVLGYLLGSVAISTEAFIGAPSVVSPYGNFIGIYSLGVYATGRRVWWGPPLVLVGIPAYFIGLGVESVSAPAGVLFSWLLAWALGYSTGRRREEQRASQRLLRRQAIAEERARIARELHDLVGHTVNVMLVQVGAARRLLDRDVAQSGTLLSAVESTGRDALGELDRMLGILRQGEPASADEPGLPSLPDLVRRMRDVGIDVALDVDERRHRYPQREPLRVPDHPGGTHQRAQTRTGQGGSGRRAPQRRGPRPRGLG
jgi:signal transduction histidine kinase